MKNLIQIKGSLITAFLLLLQLIIYAQISPGPLSIKHAKLEGMSNCTQCHIVGKGLSDAKCLACHKEIQQLRSLNRGLHAKGDIKSKSCVACHSDHHGKNFIMVKLNETNFNHQEAGYILEGSHKQVKCKECHQAKFIKDPKLASRKKTFLGLQQQCTVCHEDIHKGTFKGSCLDCHSMQKFSPAAKFNHNQTKFALKGAHKSIACKDCHKAKQNSADKLTSFKITSFGVCTACHKDEHKGKFGQNCSSCHNENSFKQIAQNFTKQFNHHATDYPLLGQHTKLQCKQCHKGKSFTEPIKFNLCKDCHTDYHNGEFAKAGKIVDCKDCHELEQAFTQSNFDIEKHTKTNFPLVGAHMATLCTACHQKEGQWKFKSIGSACIDCHTDQHLNKINKTYYLDNSCANCHNNNQWKEIHFNHDKTGYLLKGKHAGATCVDCHYKNQEQHFNIAQKDCAQCHKNMHGKQFEIKGITNCAKCHINTANWKADLFDHNATSFPLDGQHSKVGCASCHKKIIDTNGQSLILYKSNQLKCINCHS